jgi:8-oxo-dGTP pyrophosphatase MutT (NUDIX family)
MEDFKAKLKQQLQGEKPGIRAQLLMAPKFREEELMQRDANLPSKKSAVLILFNPFSPELSIIITKRSSRLKVHRGQVSLPGGSVDKHDVDAEATALRETWEEIGIPSKHVEVIGQLSGIYIPPTNFDIVPVVGFLKEKHTYNINPDEVAEVVEVPLSQLMDSNNIKSKVFYTSSSGEDRKAPYYDVMGLEIWGATAMILSEMVEIVKVIE